MRNIVAQRSILRKPSRGELIFFAILAFVIFGDGASGSGRDVLPAPFDWLQQSVVAQINQKDYDGDGVIIAIDEQTFTQLGRNEWTRTDLAQVIENLSVAGPESIVVDRQYFASAGPADVARLRAVLEAQQAELYWQVAPGPDDMANLVPSGMLPPSESSRSSFIRLDPGAQGLAEPVAMAFLPSLLPAPLEVWYSIKVEDANLPSAAQVLSDGKAPSLNMFDVDLSYDPSSIPVFSASEVLNDSFGASDIRGKKIIISFVDNLARDTLRTPGRAYTSRAAATLLAAKTLEDGPPLRIGWLPAFLVGLTGALAWVFFRRPLGRWVALTAFTSLLIVPVFLQKELIFQSTSPGVVLLIFLAIGKVWMRGREAVKTYRSAAETKSRFLAQASHDLRQPIHAIGLLSERLAQTDLSSDQSELVSKISWSVDNASRMFRALLDVAAIESGTLQKDIGPVSINELLAEIDNQNGLVAEQTGVDLRLVPSDLVVRTDRALIGTMLQNLVSNAIKYSPGKKVVVGCRRSGKRISIQVVDSGGGISASDIKHVQKEFYRSSSKSRLGSENKGLGLAIVNRLAVMLGLKFVLSSEEGKGTAASIHDLPLATGKLVANQERQAKKLPLSGLRVVLADDDEETLKSTEKLLEQWGCEVASFGRFPESDLVCDILLSDFDFGESGTLEKQVDTIARITSNGTRLIIISGHHPDSIRDSLPGLPDLILSKPLRAAELRSALMSVRV